MVIDHVGYTVSPTNLDHTLIASDHFIQSDVILGPEKIKVEIISTYSHLSLLRI